MFFCYDCNGVFCSYCVDDNLTNHKPYSTIQMQKLMRIRKKRIATIREQIKEFIEKHDSTNNEINKNEDEKQKQIQFSNDMIDQFAKKLHREVDDFKVGAKDMIKTNASNTWNKNPTTSTQQVAVNTRLHTRSTCVAREMRFGAVRWTNSQ